MIPGVQNPKRRNDERPYKRECVMIPSHTTLRTMQFGHGGLDWMHVIIFHRPNPLDSRHMTTVSRQDWHQACVYRKVLKLVIVDFGESEVW